MQKYIFKSKIQLFLIWFFMRNHFLCNLEPSILEHKQNLTALRYTLDNTDTLRDTSPIVCEDIRQRQFFTTCSWKHSSCSVLYLKKLMLWQGHNLSFDFINKINIFTFYNVFCDRLWLISQKEHIIPNSFRKEYVMACAFSQNYIRSIIKK